MSKPAVENNTPSTLADRRIRAVAFDMDGLMFNTEDLYDEVIQNLLRQRGQQFTRELKIRMMGLRDAMANDLLRRECGLAETAEQLSEIIHRELAALLETKLRMLRGLEELLELFTDRSIPMAVATSSSPRLANRALELTRVKHRFAFVLTSQDVTNGKPHPEIYLQSAARFEVPPRDLLVLEDSVNGSKAGAAAGALTVAVPGHHSADQDFSHADLVANSLDAPELITLINTCC